MQSLLQVMAEDDVGLMESLRTLDDVASVHWHPKADVRAHVDRELHNACLESHTSRCGMQRIWGQNGLMTSADSGASQLQMILWATGLVSLFAKMSDPHDPDE